MKIPMPNFPARIWIFFSFFPKLKQKFSLLKWNITKEYQQITKNEISEAQTKVKNSEPKLKGKNTRSKYKI